MANSGSGARYAGVARYLESLEMAGSDLETPPQSHPVVYDDDDDDDVSRPHRLATGVVAAAKPEVKDDDVTHRTDTTSPPGSRLRQQVDKINYYIITNKLTKICWRSVESSFGRPSRSGSASAN